jgi:hypothetical protein
VRSGGASRDDANDFFVVLLIRSMNRTRPYGSNCYPTFLIVESGVMQRNRPGMVLNENGRFAANLVLVKVLPVLLLVPCKSHGSPGLS